MDKVINIEEALKRIEELEKENAELRKELEYYRNRKISGRQKHNAKWMAIYNDFVVGYESGMTMVEIAKRNNVSERTIYRYKAYYDKMKKKEDCLLPICDALEITLEQLLTGKGIDPEYKDADMDYEVTRADICQQ